MFLCFYVFMFLCFYVFMFLCFYVFMFLCFYVFMFLCFYVFMFLCFYVFMFLCFYVFMFLCFYFYVLWFIFFAFRTPHSAFRILATLENGFLSGGWQPAFYFESIFSHVFEKCAAIPFSKCTRIRRRMAG